MASPLRFDGQVAVVTGAGRGIGRAEALLLAERGARVVVNDWGRSITGHDSEEHPADEVVAAIRGAGGTAVVDDSDVGTVEGCRTVVERAHREWGRVDILVNNAGSFSRAADPGAMTDEGIDLVIRTHLLATIRTCRHAWPIMVAQGYGRIVNTSSSTMLGVPNSWDYPAAKGGVFGLTRSLAVTGRSRNVKVNAIMPMAYTRPMDSHPNESIRGWMRASFRPEQVAPAVAYLAHRDVPVSGECFAVGGGRVARIATIGAPGFHKEAGDLTVEDIAAHWHDVTDLTGATVLSTSSDEAQMYGSVSQSYPGPSRV